MMYKLLRNFLFLFPPEPVHHFSMGALRWVCRSKWLRKRLAGYFNSGSRSTSLQGIRFKNFVGLGAGFDKNALYLEELETLGFGFVEIGTVTPLPQPGNEQPRLFRLPKDRALINRMGFNNDGASIIAARLRNWREKRLSTTENLVIGGNIGKNKTTSNEDAWKDYELAFRALHDCVDYFVVNVSSPNTPGLRALQDKDMLEKILVNLQNSNRQFAHPKPLFLKIAPDLNQQQIDDVIDLALTIRLDGLVAANTTISRADLITSATRLEQIGAGGLSGAPLRARSTEIVDYIRQKTNGSLTVIASGGIFSAADAMEKMNAGASLIQVWTGFIYEGPGIVRKILKGSTTQ